MKKEAPFFNEASVANQSLTFYSDNSEVASRDFVLNLQATQSLETHKVSPLVSKRIREIQIALQTVELLAKLGYPAILSASLYQALKMKGNK
jgi:hypothetical protein